MVVYCAGHQKGMALKGKGEEEVTLGRGSLEGCFTNSSLTHRKGGGNSKSEKQEKKECCKSEKEGQINSSSNLIWLLSLTFPIKGSIM